MSFEVVFFLCLALSAAVIGRHTRISGGREISIWQHSYMAGFTYMSIQEHICGGAIISTRHVLTAGQCVDERVIEIHDLKIRVGTSNITESNLYMDGLFYEIEQIFLHPDYTNYRTLASTYQNDIAVVKTRIAFEFSYLVNRIDLPTSDIIYGTIGYVSGWGKNGVLDTNRRKLKKTWMAIMDPDTCENSFEAKLLLDQFCAFHSRGVGACIGDVGSPLVADNILVGLVSLFDPCALGIPDIYVNVYSHVDYIHSILNL